MAEKQTQSLNCASAQLRRANWQNGGSGAVLLWKVRSFNRADSTLGHTNLIPNQAVRIKP